MTRRRVILITAVVVAVLLVGIIAASWQAHWHAQAGARAYNCAQIGRDEAEVLAAVKLPASPHAVSGFQRYDLRLVAEDGVAHFSSDQVNTERRSDGSVLYRRQSDGQVAGWVRWWDTSKHKLVVIFGPDGKVIGRTLYEEAGPQRKNWFEKTTDWIGGLFDR